MHLLLEVSRYFFFLLAFNTLLTHMFDTLTIICRGVLIWFYLSKYVIFGCRFLYLGLAKFSGIIFIMYILHISVLYLSCFFYPVKSKVWSAVHI